ncbi:MAG: O-antigen ligase family protein [Candidatus Omnitrophica bacterium]|nr:O-antigen ligase family protein [Candidatus Omnitrophota bacterium]MDE2223297.1 O-antigen ligase family protein [Candidatus Omnitrophota bacterium]
MRNSYLLDYKMMVTVFASVCLGCVLTGVCPFFERKPLLLLAWPSAAFFFVLMVTQPKGMTAAILLVRPLLDILLNLTKVNVAGEGVGIGAVLNLAVILLAVFLAFYMLNLPRRVFPVYLWIVFLLLMVLCACYSPYPREGVRICFNYFSYFALFIIPFLIIKNQEDFLFWLRVLAASFILPVLYADVDMARGGHYFEDAGMRIMGTFTHPNILAFYLVLAFTFYFYLFKSGYFQGRPFSGLVARLFMINILVLLVATKTRNAWLAVYVVFLIYGLLKDRKILWILVLAVPLLTAIPPVAQRITNIFNGHSENGYRGLNSYEWRLQLWQSSLAQIAERPLQGHGLGTFKPSTERFFTQTKDTHAHNTYIEVLFECGLIGLASFIALLGGTIVAFIQCLRRAVQQSQQRVWAIMISYLLSYMLICMADNLSYYLVFNWYVWFFVGLMLAAEVRRYPIEFSRPLIK